MSRVEFYPHLGTVPLAATILLEHGDGTANLEVDIPGQAPVFLGGVPRGAGEPGTWAPVSAESPEPDRPVMVEARPLLVPTIAEVASPTVPPAARSHAQRQTKPPPAPVREEAGPVDGDLLPTILAAVKEHPMLMSATLLASLLRGETLGRLGEKGLDASPYFGKLADVAGDLPQAIQVAMERKWLARASGLYPALYVTPAGLARSVEQAGTATAPDEAFKLYHAWRRAQAHGQKRPPYRVVPSEILLSLARIQPATLEQLLAVPGLGKTRALRYQQELLAIGQQLATKEVAHA